MSMYPEANFSRLQLVRPLIWLKIFSVLLSSIDKWKMKKDKWTELSGIINTV